MYFFCFQWTPWKDVVALTWKEVQDWVFVSLIVVSLKCPFYNIYKYYLHYLYILVSHMGGVIGSGLWTLSYLSPFLITFLHTHPLYESCPLNITSLCLTLSLFINSHLISRLKLLSLCTKLCNNPKQNLLHPSLFILSLNFLSLF